jgi:hypothetical protein
LINSARGNVACDEGSDHWFLFRYLRLAEAAAWGYMLTLSRLKTWERAFELLSIFGR